VLITGGGGGGAGLELLPPQPGTVKSSNSINPRNIPDTRLRFGPPNSTTEKSKPKPDIHCAK
jgi:hypothetical protein